MQFLKALLITVAIGAISAFFLYQGLINFGPRLADINPAPEPVLKAIEKKVSAPPPLRAKESAPSSFLTEDGIMRFTNLERSKNGLRLLQANPKLNNAASLKIKDMFENQYFAHVSPAGLDAGDLAKKAGYAHIVIGENLAMGDFANDEKLVAGWMASPGHRANILNDRYQEIGVAVGRGVIEGRFTWLAVQIFGKPLSSCLEPDQNLKTSISDGEKTLEELRSSLETLKMEIENTNPRKDREEYNRKIDAFNALVQQYNSLVETLKDLIKKYNGQVETFNFCVKS